MPRLFIAHSNKHDVEALGFQHWLTANGWKPEDVFIDLHRSDAGEHWCETLRRAKASCEAVILLASSHGLETRECRREIDLAEDLDKEIIIANVCGVAKDDARLAHYADRQFVDLTTEPTEHVETFEDNGCVHRVAFHLPALASINAHLANLGTAPNSFAWTPIGSAGPYPGLSAFGEGDAGIFFGRDTDIQSCMTDLHLLRKRRSPRLLAIQGASGVGKSSFLRAGLWPRISRDPDFAPLAILRPAQGILTGPDGIGRRLAPWFERHGRVKLPADIHAGVAQASAEAGAAALTALLSEATALATAARRADNPEARPPAPVIAIDQGDELFAAEDAAESERFLRLLAVMLAALPDGVDPVVVITLSAAGVDGLLRRDAQLGLEAPMPLYLQPLSAAAYRDVIMMPAQVYSERVRRLAIEPALVDKLVADATGPDALPQLAFALSEMFRLFAPSRVLTLSQYEQIGGIGGCTTRVLEVAQKAAGAAGSDDNLRRLIVPGLATWDPAAGAAKRLVGNEDIVTAGDRARLAPLANALVEARLLTRRRERLEVAHEALLRHEPIAGWLEQCKDALKLRDDVLREAGVWSETRQSTDLVRRGARLRRARKLLADPDFTDALAPAKDYLAVCRKRARAAQALVATLVVSVVAIGTLGYGGFLNPTYLEGRVSGVRNSLREVGWKPGDTFSECGRNCPVMVVVPAGKFMMGSSDAVDEKPPHEVKIAKAFAVGKFEVTFAEWDACYDGGGCSFRPSDRGWGRGRRPVINVSWNDVQRYLRWLSTKTGVEYRLLTEAEWEYAARGGTDLGKPHTKYSSDDEIIKGNANCDGCGSPWANVQTAPVGSFKPNAFGLYDMHGNVWEWVEDAYRNSYVGVPSDGSPWRGESSSSRVLRGGSWYDIPFNLRSSARDGYVADGRSHTYGFRVARTLGQPARPRPTTVTSSRNFDQSH